MGRKKYFCDFCNRFFNDDKNTRAKHLNSVNHLNLKKEHYNLFRDLETIYREESVKKPCRKFHLEGFCPFSGACTYSHYTKQDLEAIKQQSLWQKAQENYIPTINEWLVKYELGIDSKTQIKRQGLWSTQMPPELATTSSLPPSVLPFSIQEFMNADLARWGE